MRNKRINKDLKGSYDPYNDRDQSWFFYFKLAFGRELVNEKYWKEERRGKKWKRKRGGKKGEKEKNEKEGRKVGRKGGREENFSPSIFSISISV